MHGFEDLWVGCSGFGYMLRENFDKEFVWPDNELVGEEYGQQYDSQWQ